MHWRLILGLIGTALAAAALFVWSGVYSVAATSGHSSPSIGTFLDFAPAPVGRGAGARHSRHPARRSHDDPPGAGHYRWRLARSPRSARGARSPVSRGMLPEPPDLGPQIEEWTPASSSGSSGRHQITGMPAWPAPRARMRSGMSSPSCCGCRAWTRRRIAASPSARLEAAVARADEESFASCCR